MKYLNEEEVKLLNEMKDRCLNGGQYKDENSKKKFNMLCHLEDFAVQYYNYKELYEKEKKNCKELIKFLEEEENRKTFIDIVSENRICSEIKTDNVLLIFDNEQQKRKYKKYLKQNNLCEIDKILITLNDLLYENTLDGLRYKRYWFITERDMKDIED